MSAFKHFIRSKPESQVDDRKRPITEEEKRQWEIDHKIAMSQMEAAETVKARQWLEDNHIVAKNVVGPERRKKLLAYIARLKSEPKPGPRDWAYSLKTDYIDGLPLLQIQITTASAALGEVWENRQCRPM